MAAQRVGDVGHMQDEDAVQRRIAGVKNAIRIGIHIYLARHVAITARGGYGHRAVIVEVQRIRSADDLGVLEMDKSYAARHKAVFGHAVE